MNMLGMCSGLVADTSKVMNNLLYKLVQLMSVLLCMAVAYTAEAAKYKASKSSVRTISERLNHYFPDDQSLVIKRLARKIAEGKYDNFYFINMAEIITDGIFHINDKNSYLPDGLKSLQLPEDMRGCQSAIVLRRYFTHFLEYDCSIADRAVQSVQLINIIDLQSGEKVAYQPIETLKKIASKRYKKDKQAGHVVQFVADAYHISDYSWEMFNIITYNLVKYLFSNEKLELVAGTHLFADVELAAEQANIPAYLLADFLKIEKLVKLYIHNMHTGDELAVLNQELRDNLDQAAYTIAETWRENLGDKQRNIPPTNNMVVVLHESLMQHAESLPQSSD